MNATRLLLNTYYEVLYERLGAGRERLVGAIDELLGAEIERQGCGAFDQEKLEAYRDACIAFIDERIEMYNPTGVQYLFDETSVEEAFKLEMALNWYDSRAEFRSLVELARAKVTADLAEERLRDSAEELISQAGAYPDKSIIADYESYPGLNKLPDYVVARVIEQFIRRA